MTSTKAVENDRRVDRRKHIDHAILALFAVLTCVSFALRISETAIPWPFLLMEYAILIAVAWIVYGAGKRAGRRAPH